MGRDKLYGLLAKYREGKCSPEEIAQLEEWYASYDGESEKLPAVPHEKLDMLYYGIERRIAGRPRTKKILRFAIPAAAACILAMATLLIHNRITTQSGDIISSGTWQAELIVDDGNRILLGTQAVADAAAHGFTVSSEQGKGISYSEPANQGAATVYHSIVVPVGSEYGVTLADGTRVRLNSGTTLRYPVSFEGEQREVTLSGEAYFEVSKSDRPFVVNTPSIGVKVLGTTFNISAYDEDTMAEATLVSGSIAVRADDREYRLEPGHILSYDRSTGAVAENEVDTSVSTSWIDGEFKFRDMRLEDIMKKLNRWYDCQVIFADPQLKELRFSGAAEKDRPIQYVLEMIEFVTYVDFDVRGNTITVTRK